MVPLADVGREALRAYTPCARAGRLWERTGRSLLLPMLMQRLGEQLQGHRSLNRPRRHQAIRAEHLSRSMAHRSVAVDLRHLFFDSHVEDANAADRGRNSPVG
jgi:hypothetical protein